MKKKVLIGFSSLFVALIAAVFGGHAWLKGRFEKEQLVAQMEAAWNCRVHLDGTAVSILSMPARVELRGLKLAPRDGEVGKVLSNRAPMDEKTTLVSLERAVLAVELVDLLRGKLSVKQLHLYGLDAKTDVRADGETSLRDLFAKPDMEKKIPSKPADGASVSAKAQDVKAADALTPAKSNGENHEFKAGDMMMALQVDEAGVDNANFTITNRENGTVIMIEHVSFSLKNIDVNADNLANHNHCDLDYEASLLVEKMDDKTQMANFTVSGSGSMNPFDADTREWDPDLTLKALVKKGALLGGLPMEKQLSTKNVKKMSEWGVDFTGIAVGGVLGEEAATQVHVVHGKTIIKQDTRLVFPQYEITLLSGSWFHARNDAINAHGKLVAGPELTQKILTTARETIIKKVGSDSLADLAVALIEKSLVDEKKRLNFPFQAKGKLSDPKVDLDSMLGDIKDAIQDAGKNLLRGLLGQ